MTGGAGFIGSSLVRALLTRFPDRRIVVLDDFTYAGDRDNLPQASPDLDRLEVLKADVTDGTAVSHAISGSSLVFHLAAETHETRSIFDSSRFVHTDVVGTQVLLTAAAAEEEPPLFVHVSTSEVYGNAQCPLMDEEHPLLPMSPYAAAKVGADRLVYSYVQTYALPAVIVRPFNNYGPRQHLEKHLPRFITSALGGAPLRMHGDGSARRDFIFVEDTCAALVAIADAPRAHVEGEVFNVASGLDVSVRELAELILALIPESESALESTSDRPGQVSRHTGNASKIASRLGWRPSTSLEDGMRRTIDWYVRNEAWWRRRWESREIPIRLPNGGMVMH